MRLLILGGTVFLGRAVVDAAAQREHRVTLFTRGRSARREDFPGVEWVQGDRDGGLSALAGGEWDAVIDTSGFVPRVVRESAHRLLAATEHYTFVSSISAYGDFRRRRLREDDPVATAEPDSEDVERYYDELKAACEREVMAAFGARALIVRPGLIVGPHDPTERFTYWVRRLASASASAEPVLAPRATEQPAQLIDARDLAAWIVAMAERRQGGTFNATGPARPLTFTEMLERMRAAIGGRAELRWLDEAALADAAVEPWEELPLWLDLPRHPELAGFLDVDNTRAMDSGLEFRSLEDTTADTLAWAERTPIGSIERFGKPVPLPGLTRERERELLSTGAV